MLKDRARYILDHAPTMLLLQALRADPGAKLDLDQAIHWAGALWDSIAAGEARGSGARAGDAPASLGTPPVPGGRAATTKPRATVDYYGALAPELRAGFDTFYRAYALPKGKQRAAMRWAEIAPDAALAKRISEAAAADHALPRAADAVRKYPEGWLSERRWEDLPAPGASPADADPAAAQAREIRELINERAGLRRLARGGDPHITALLADIERRLADYGVADETPIAPVRATGPRPLAEFLRGRA